MSEPIQEKNFKLITYSIGSTLIIYSSRVDLDYPSSDHLTLPESPEKDGFPDRVEVRLPMSLGVLLEISTKYIHIHSRQQGGKQHGCAKAAIH